MRNKKALIVVALLLLISVSFTSYAIYKSKLDANATVSAAIWDVTFEDSSSVALTQNITFTSAECSNNHVAPGKIAPGATCTKTIILNAGNSEVDVTYSATAGAATVGGNAVSASANQFTVSLTPASGTITYDASGRTATLTLQVAWGGTDDSPTDTTNAADTALQGSTITVPVTLVASQVPVSSQP